MRPLVPTGWEWADPTSAVHLCGSMAEDIETGQRFTCQLQRGHTSDVCHWQEVKGDTVLSASWIPYGIVTFIGGGGRMTRRALPVSPHKEQTSSDA